MADRLAQGELGEMMIQLGPHGTLTITVMSDNLRDDLSPTYTTLTFESLTWAYYPAWMYSVARTLSGPLSISDGAGLQHAIQPAEISEALLEVP